MIRLNKYIAMCNICSRRSADEYIENRRVKVNDVLVTDLGTKVDISDKVYVDDKLIKIEEEKVYIMLNKPYGYISTSNDQFNRASVLDLIKEDIRVYPVGRLDYDTEGLILLTNDGDLTNRITHPKNHIKKVYNVKTKENITDDIITKLSNGIKIEDYTTNKAVVDKISNTEFNITIYEGKNRQVRKMCESVDLTPINLKRIQIGNLRIGNLKSGEYIKVSKSEIEKLK
ncbi:MAG: pseudouridine synthase [Clostridia bacterium]